MATPTALAAVVEGLAAAPAAAAATPLPATSSASSATADTSISTSPSANIDSANGLDGSQDPVDDDVAWLNVNELTAEETDELAKCLNTCVERWKAAGPEARKKMFALFAVTGIFISVCRHGHVLLICDMIRSGEL